MLVVFILSAIGGNCAWLCKQKLSNGDYGSAAMFAILSVGSLFFAAIAKLESTIIDLYREKQRNH